MNGRKNAECCKSDGKHTSIYALSAPSKHKESNRMESIVQLYSELAKDVTNKKEEEEKDEYKSNRIKKISLTFITMMET